MLTVKSATQLHTQPIIKPLTLCFSTVNIPASCISGTSISIQESEGYVAFTVFNIIAEDLYESHFLQKFTDIFCNVFDIYE